MRMGWGILVALALLLAPGATRAQSLTEAPALSKAPVWVWPKEFAGERMSCRALSEARATYMATARPKFFCTKGIDCPLDLQPGAPVAFDFRVYYSWEGAAQGEDLTLDQYAVGNLKFAIRRLLADLDNVARSRSRSIHVTAYTDTEGTPAENIQKSKIIAQCIADALNISMHLNGYEEAYEFPLVADARGETDLAKPTADGVSEPLNRRALVKVSY